MTPIDLALFRALYGAHASGAFGSWMLALSALGNGWVGIAVVPFPFWRRTRVHALALLAAIFAQAWSVFALKRIVARTRPWMALGLRPPHATPHDFSFPSGHATASFTVCAFLATLLVRSDHPVRHPLALALLVTAGAISVSRVFLGAHWPTDVAFGALFGTALGTLAARLASRWAAAGRRL